VPDATGVDRRAPARLSTGVRRIVPLVLVAALASACDSSPDPIDDVDDFLTQARRADCEASKRCGLFQTVDQCLAFQAKTVATWTAVWTAAYQERRVDATARGAMAYAPDEAARCVEELRERSCDRRPWSRQLTPASCTRALHGVAALGAVVYDGLECESGFAWPDLRCEDTCCPATCVEPLDRSLPGDGDACGQFGECGDGLVCDGDVCRAAPGRGHACALDLDCGDRLVCVEGRCDRPRHLGERCVPSVLGPIGQSLQAQCAHVDETCAGDPPTCRKVPLRGDRCGPVEPCGQGLYCDRDAGRCVGFGEEGAPCHGETCAGDLWCGPVAGAPSSQAQICQRPLADGGRCGAPWQCASGYCEVFAGICQSVTCP
jgi:hypothetical protein